MTKNELAKELAVSEHLHLSTATQAVDGILRIIKNALADGDDITLRGFGTISTVKREARNAVDFKTNTSITIPAFRTVRIKISKELKNILNNEVL